LQRKAEIRRGKKAATPGSTPFTIFNYLFRNYIVQKLTPCLWFNFNAEEAVNYYLGIFKNGKVIEVSRYGDAMPALKGKVLTMRFEIEGQELQALNAGPQFPFTEAISMSVNCADQTEVDTLWAKLCEGGAPGQCGWLKDKFGLSWQIVPSALIKMLKDPDAVKAQRVMAAMMQMQKIDIAVLTAAYKGSGS
jgi:predicted 3-demethylubiquinone-9 3-methyltransferase (glyoxalase superfamily)